VLLFLEARITMIPVGMGSDLHFFIFRAVELPRTPVIIIFLLSYNSCAQTLATTDVSNIRHQAC
jgi:anaerobic C4-dicarboxylate transporter